MGPKERNCGHYQMRICANVMTSHEHMRVYKVGLKASSPDDMGSDFLLICARLACRGIDQMTHIDHLSII